MCSGARRGSARSRSSRRRGGSKAEEKGSAASLIDFQHSGSGLTACQGPASSGYWLNMDSLFEHRVQLAGHVTRALEIDGDGPGIVLLHGWSHSADTWRPLLRE